VAHDGRLVCFDGHRQQAHEIGQFWTLAAPTSGISVALRVGFMAFVLLISFAPLKKACLASRMLALFPGFN